MSGSTPFRVTPVYDRLLRGDERTPVGLYHLQLATADQLCRLHYSPGSITAVKARLKTLVDHRYLQADRVPTKQYKSPYYYTLGEQGARYLAALGLDIKDSFRASKEINKHWLFLQHTLELNDVLIAATLVQRVDPRYHLERFIHERVLKRTIKASVVPDAFLDFRATGPDGAKRRMPVLVEHDRGTEDQPHFRGKVRSYIALLKDGGYQQLFGARAITIVFTTFVSASRLQQMRLWTDLELARTHESQAIRNTFLFAHLTKPLDPQAVWLEPCWEAPNGDERVSLLRLQ